MEKSFYLKKGTIQGDPLAMTMYAIGIGWISKWSRSGMQTMLLQGDVYTTYTASGIKSPLLWSRLWLLCKRIKDMASHQARACTAGQWIVCHLRDANHCESEKTSRSHIRNKTIQGSLCEGQSLRVGGWSEMTIINCSQPTTSSVCCPDTQHAQRWTYLMRTMPSMSDLFFPVEEAIRCNFLPVLTGRTELNDFKRNLLELPARLGGLGIMNPTKCVDIHHRNSIQIAAQLTATILSRRGSSLETSIMNKWPLNNKWRWREEGLCPRKHPDCGSHFQPSCRELWT